MEAEVEQARMGNLAYFQQQLSADQLTQLLKKKDEDGRSLLHAAAASGSLELCQYLCDHGAQGTLDSQDDEGWAPLHTAVSCGHVPVSQYLVSCGATVNLANSGKRTPLHYAASKGNVQLIKFLLEHGAKPNARDMTGCTALHRAASAGKEEAVKALLRSGKCKLESEDGEGNTPLMLAVLGGHKNLALYLAQQGADLQAANKAGETPMSVAGDLAPALQAAAGKGPMDEDD